MSKYRDRNRESITNHIVDLEGRFFPNDVTAIDNTQNKGHGFTVFRNGVGDFTVTLTDEFLSLISFKVHMQNLAVNADSQAELGDVDLSAKTIDIRIVKKSDGTVVDGAAYDANQSVSFRFSLKQTEVI